MPGSEAEFAALEREVIDHVFELQPGYAVFLGLHQYDGRLPDLRREATDRWLSVADRLLQRLAVASEGLGADREIDQRLLELLLEGPSFDLQDSRDLEQNPMSYLGGISLTPYLVRDYAPPPQRVGAIVRTLEGIPSLLEVGMRRLEPRLPTPFLTLAITIGEGLPSNFAEAEEFARHTASALGDRVAAARETAEAAVATFLDRIRTEWMAKATDEFALGPERFQRLLWVREGIRTPYREILEQGERDLQRNEARLRTLASTAVPAQDVAGLLGNLYRDHPSAGELISFAEGAVARVRSFVEEKELVTIPTPEHCRVEETPTYGRALSTASMNPPGPFDRTGEEGVYYVTPVDPAWPAEQQEEWLRSLNRPMLANITVHEVYPGHYLQFLHHRRARASLARKVYLSPSFTEGWAHYCEELAIEAGFGAASPAAEAAQLHDALLRDCRLVASIGLHTSGLGLEGATELFEHRAHMERLPAQREAIRGTFDPGYFCYTLGKLAIRRERDRLLQRRFGGSMKGFHDRLLSFGSPPVGLLPELLGG